MLTGSGHRPQLHHQRILGSPLLVYRQIHQQQTGATTAAVDFQTYQHVPYSVVFKGVLQSS